MALATDQTLGLAEVLKAQGFDLVLTVPCSILRQWYFQPAGPPTVLLSREEEGVGIAAGALAAGKKPLLMIQNSGLGNCINALASLAIAYAIPMLVAVSLRGDEVDENPAQRPMGLATTALISAIGSRFETIDDHKDTSEIFQKGLDMAQREHRPYFVLLPRYAP